MKKLIPPTHHQAIFDGSVTIAGFGKNVNDPHMAIPWSFEANAKGDLACRITARALSNFALGEKVRSFASSASDYRAEQQAVKLPGGKELRLHEKQTMALLSPGESVATRSTDNPLLVLKVQSGDGNHRVLVTTLMMQYHSITSKTPKSTLPLVAKNLICACRGKQMSAWVGFISVRPKSGPNTWRYLSALRLELDTIGINSVNLDMGVNPHTSKNQAGNCLWNSRISRNNQEYNLFIVNHLT